MRNAASFIAGQSACSSENLLSRAARTLRTAFQTWNSRRKLVRLLDLDDHMLADVGVTREDVKWALDLPFAHDPALELQRRALRHRAQGWRS